LLPTLRLSVIPDAINSGSVTESNLGSYLDTLKGQGATDADIADIRETYQSTYYNDYMAQITAGTLLSTKEVDDAYNAGNLSKEHYDNLKKAWNDDINTGSNAFDGYDSYESAKKDYNEIINNNKGHRRFIWHLFCVYTDFSLYSSRIK